MVIMMAGLAMLYRLLVKIIQSGLLLIGSDARHNDGLTLRCLLNLAGSTVYFES